MGVSMRTFGGIAAAIAMAWAQPAGAAETPAAGAEAPARPVLIEFREFFNREAMPSERAIALSGSYVEVVGFFAPPPFEDVPFRVLVGAPTESCPYCEPEAFAAGGESLPFVLVHPAPGQPDIGASRRVRVVGRVEAHPGNTDPYGLTRELRLHDAAFRRDARFEDPRILGPAARRGGPLD
ncbi:MAG: hypothetical protein MI723_14535 [Caulobacterales bacterium]|nr:hypothetical protein [Caulobacterales bacterium]